MSQHDDPQLSPADQARLERGEIIVRSEPRPGSPTPRVKVMGVIEAEPERVWPLIDQVGNYAHTMAGVKAAQELSRDGEVVRVRATIGMPFPFKDLSATSEGQHRRLGPGRYQRKWSMISGDYKSNRGSFDLYSFGQDAGRPRTLLLYQVEVEPKIKLPKKLQELAQKKAAPRMVQRLRELTR